MAKIGGSADLLMGLMSMLTGLATERWIAAGASATVVRKSFLGTGT